MHYAIKNIYIFPQSLSINQTPVFVLSFLQALLQVDFCFMFKHTTTACCGKYLPFKKIKERKKSDGGEETKGLKTNLKGTKTKCDL